MPHLENWMSVEGTDGAQRLRGNIYHDEKGRFADGTVVTTSKVLDLNISEQKALTQNTLYMLGVPAKANKLGW